MLLKMHRSVIGTTDGGKVSVDDTWLKEEIGYLLLCDEDIMYNPDAETISQKDGIEGLETWASHKADEYLANRTLITNDMAECIILDAYSDVQKSKIKPFGRFDPRHDAIDFMRGIQEELEPYCCTIRLTPDIALSDKTYGIDDRIYEILYGDEPVQERTYSMEEAKLATDFLLLGTDLNDSLFIEFPEKSYVICNCDTEEKPYIEIDHYDPETEEMTPIARITENAGRLDYQNTPSNHDKTKYPKDDINRFRS